MSLPVFAMRGVLPVFGFFLFLLQPALAQGVKEPPNYPASSVPSWQKMQASKSSPSTSRPTAVRNIAPGRLPYGVTAQSVYRDGKLVAVPRY